MNCAALTHARLLEVLGYDEITGQFINLTKRGAYEAGSAAGSPHALGYIAICIDTKKYLAHRLAWMFVHGTWPCGVIDHINGVRNDNRIVNLRDITHRMNIENRKGPSRGRAFLGVSKKRNRWRARIMVDGVEIRLGTYATPEIAQEKYLEAKRELHKGNTL